MGVGGFMLKQLYLLYPWTGRPCVLNRDMFYMLGIVQLKIYGKFSSSMKITVLWDVLPCSCVEIYR